MKKVCGWSRLTKDDWQSLVALAPKFERELKKYSKFTLNDLKLDEFDPFYWLS